MDRYHTRLPFTEVATLQQATALGRVDFWIVKGWVPPEEWLYPQVQEALSAWTIIRHDGSVLHNPSFADIASAHGIEVQPADQVYDLAILGAGPAGLAAAVYGASEGLRTVVVEQLAIVGQAGTSSLIRNCLGFPRGLSGGELAHRAWQQAGLFGAQLCSPTGPFGLRQVRTTTSSRSTIEARPPLKR